MIMIIIINGIYYYRSKTITKLIKEKNNINDKKNNNFSKIILLKITYNKINKSFINL